MASLVEILQEPAKRKAIIDECVVIIDQEVASKGGISGIAIKGGYKIVKGVKPGFIPESVDSLLDEFAKNLDPLIQEAQREGKPVAAHMTANRGTVADAMLAVTDGRAQRSRHGVVKGAYEKLRPSAKKHVEEAVPRVAAMIEKFTA